MKIGYARVSTKGQDLSLQIDALKREGCEEIYKEKASGRKKDRKELEEMLDNIRKGDEVIVYSLDRLGRTRKQFLDLLDEFKKREVHFKSLSEGYFDTTTPMGQAIFEIMAILKAMEVNVLSERTKAGLATARARGRNGGRPVGTYNKTKSVAAAHRYQQGIPVDEICSDLNISRSTLYRYLRLEGVKK
ncbi:MAG: recombinase family protein [Bacteroidota bacterium]